MVDPNQAALFRDFRQKKLEFPYADVSLVSIPDTIRDDQVILLSDILPTAYQAVEYANPQPGDTVAVFGCGPVGQLVITCLNILGVNDIIAIDRIPSRLAMAQAQGAHIINFDKQNPWKPCRSFTPQDYRCCGH